MKVSKFSGVLKLCFATDDIEPVDINDTTTCDGETMESPLRD